ncbi:MAG: hypothetical protein KDD47_01875, partial [Acidobacteria bacterium]|nr:hypothetical protein [Acidobacteriota bacterium]
MSWNPWDVLPGIYVVLFALLAGWGLKRWFDPIPVPAAGSFFAVLLVLLGPQLFGGLTLLPVDNLRGTAPFTRLAATDPHGNALQGDLLLLVAPLTKEVRGDLLAGRWPLWNDLAGIGMPLLADPQAQPFQPLTLLALPLEPLASAAVTAAFRILLALTFTFLFLRRRGCGNGPALAGALSFGLGGFLLLWLGWPLANTAALFPLVLYSQERALKRGALRDEVLLTGSMAAFLLAGHPETLVMGLAATLLFGAGDLPATGPQRRAALGRWLIAVALATGLTAPVWLPTVAYLPETRRFQMVSADQGLETTHRPVEAGRGFSPSAGTASSLAKSWVPVVAPNAFGNSRYAHYWGRQNTNEDASGFAGTAALLLAALALVRRRRDRLAGETTALAIAAGVLALLALPEDGQAALRDVPVLGGVFAHGGRRSLLFLGFGLAFLTGTGLEGAFRSPPSRRRLAALALLIGGLLAWAYFAHPHPLDPEILSVLRIGWLHWQLRFLLATTLLLAFAPRWRATTYGVACLLAAELCLLHAPAHPKMPRLRELPAPPPLDRLAAIANPGDRLVGTEDVLPPNLATLYGLSDLRIYNPMAPAAYLRYLAPALGNPGADVPVIARPQSPLLARLGSRWLLTPSEISLPPAFELVEAGPDGALYRRADASPRLYRLDSREDDSPRTER